MNTSVRHEGDRVFGTDRLGAPHNWRLYRSERAEGPEENGTLVRSRNHPGAFGKGALFNRQGRRVPLDKGPGVTARDLRGRGIGPLRQRPQSSLFSALSSG
jgi:hypothetical protein